MTPKKKGTEKGSVGTKREDNGSPTLGRLKWSCQQACMLLRI